VFPQQFSQCFLASPICGICPAHRNLDSSTRRRLR
jgi:hypothetical protein